MKVPEYDRDPPEEFTPVAWRFGLHNRENLDTNGSKAIKISYADAFGLVGDELDKFCNAVVDDPKSMLRCYGLQEEAINWSEDVVKYVLALDALFLALEFDWSIPGEYLWSSEQKASMREDVLFQMRSKSWADSGLMQFDICKYENQIPFELIERVCQYLRKLKPDKEHVLNDDQEAELYQFWEKRWKAEVVKEGVNPFMDLDYESERKEELFPLTNGQHILGLAYEAICGHEGVERTCDESQKDYIHIPSATELRESGIRIKGVPEMPLCTMSDEGHYLSLPRMNIYDSTISFIRNMGIYEEQQAGKCMFHDYVLLLLDLIKTSADLELLIDKGVVYNACGVKAFDKWTALEQGLSEVKSSREHHQMKAAIKKRCEYKRYRLWSEFNARFCSRPWLVLSTIAVVLVTLATLIQTYATIIETDRMKPQFKLFQLSYEVCSIVNKGYLKGRKWQNYIALGPHLEGFELV